MGNFGTATLNIVNGANVSAQFTVGDESSGKGTITVNGEGSRLFSNGGFVIARLGMGTLILIDGGETQAGWLAIATGSSGDNEHEFCRIEGAQLIPMQEIPDR